MTQKLLGAVGIVGVLILAGIYLKTSGANPEMGDLAIKAGVVIGIIYGFLGIIGTLKKLKN